VKFLAVSGGDALSREATIVALVGGFSRKGWRVGVVSHRILGSGDEAGGAPRNYAAAGAVQVLASRGREIVPPQKIAGLTPLRRAAARYFNAVDLLISEGYLDPVPRVVVQDARGKSPLLFRKDPSVVAEVGKERGGDGGPPVFEPGEPEALVEFLAKVLADAT